MPIRMQCALLSLLLGGSIAILEDDSLMMHKMEAFQPSAGTVIGHIDIEDEMHYEMDIEIHSFENTGSTSYMNIIHASATGGQCCSPGDRVPAIQLHDTNSAKNGFKVRFISDDGTQGDWTKVGLEVGEIYHLEIDVTQSWMTVHQDGVTVYSAAKGNHQNYEDVPVYASLDHHGAADVTISNLIIAHGSSMPVMNAIEIRNVDGEVTALEGTVSTVSGSVTALEGTVSTVSGSVTALQGTVTGLEGSLSTLQDDVDDLKETMEAMMNAIKSNMGFSAVAVNGNYEGLEAAKAGGSAATMVLTAKDLAIIGLAAVNLMIMVFFAVNCKRSSAKVRYGVVSMGSETDIDQ